MKGEPFSDMGRAISFSEINVVYEIWFYHLRPLTSATKPRGNIGSVKSRGVGKFCLAKFRGPPPPLFNISCVYIGVI